MTTQVPVSAEHARVPALPDEAIGDLDPQERIDTLLAHLGTRAGGLTSREVARRLEQHGPNQITRRGGQSRLREYVRQLAHPLALLLWIAAVLAFASGGQTLALAIVIVIMLNGLLAFAQELQAERATEALQQLLPTRVTVRRDGVESVTEATQLVPGDVIVLDEGARLSADARLIMTWAGIVGCQLGAAFAVRASRASLFEIGVFSNPHLLRGVAFALAFAAAIVYAPPLQALFHTAALPPGDLALLASFPVIVWGSDELWRWRLRRIDQRSHAAPLALSRPA